MCCWYSSAHIKCYLSPMWGGVAVGWGCCGMGLLYDSKWCTAHMLLHTLCWVSWGLLFRFPPQTQEVTFSVRGGKKALKWLFSMWKGNCRDNGLQLPDDCFTFQSIFFIRHRRGGEGGGGEARGKRGGGEEGWFYWEVITPLTSHYVSNGRTTPIEYILCGFYFFQTIHLRLYWKAISITQVPLQHLKNFI